VFTSSGYSLKRDLKADIPNFGKNVPEFLIFGKIFHFVFGIWILLETWCIMGKI
jgi:hypothetical protein